MENPYFFIKQVIKLVSGMMVVILYKPQSKKHVYPPPTNIVVAYRLISKKQFPAQLTFSNSRQHPNGFQTTIIFIHVIGVRLVHVNFLQCVCRYGRDH